jgi:hypothetical protein
MPHDDGDERLDLEKIGEAKYLTVARIEAIEEKSAAANEIKRKEKERYQALYGKGKLAQLI